MTDLAATSLDARDTLGARLDQRKTVGFDYLRLSLALLVLFWHSFAVVQGLNAAPADWYVVGMRLVLPLFFALSGFLVASSLDRLRHLPTFLTMRFLRIFPALVVETLLSAFVLGPLLTTLAIGLYFQNGEFWSYLLNIVGWVHYDLPGVFKENPVTWVNRSLWTVPFELECYIALSLLYLFGVFRQPIMMVLTLIAFCLLCVWWYPTYSYETELLVPGRLLIGYFLAGTVVYQYRDKLPGGPIPATIALIISLVMMLDTWATFASPLVVAYASAALGCTKPTRIPVIFDGDYSYGMYLYAFPIQQTVYLLLPEASVWGNAVIATILTALFAAFSWHAIEKPTVNLKNKIKRKQSSSRQPTAK